MSEPSEPRPTCPLVDQGIDLCNDIMKECDRNEPSHGDIQHFANSVAGLLEDIRSENIKIREWGTHWKERAENAEEFLEAVKK